MKYSHSWFVAMMLNQKELLRTEFTRGETYYLKFEWDIWIENDGCG